MQDYPLLVAEYWEKKTAVVVRVFDTKTSRYETLQTYGDHYRFLTETRLHEGRQDISKKRILLRFHGVSDHKKKKHSS